MAEELKKYRIVIPHFSRDGIFHDKDSIVEAYPSDASVTWFDAETGEPVPKKIRAGDLGALSEEEKAFILELRGAKPEAKVVAPVPTPAALATSSKPAPSKGRAADKEAL